MHLPRRAGRTRWLVTLTLVVVVAATACRGGYRGTIATTGEPKPTDIPHNIVDVLEADEQQRFTTLVDLIEKGELTTLLSGTGPLTLFAPTNQAFARAFSPAQLAALSEQTAALKKELELHVTPKDVTFSPPPYVTSVSGNGTTVFKVDGRTDLDAAGMVLVTTPKPLTMLDGETLTVSPSKTLTLPSSSGTARIIDADIQAPNGFIQVIDQVLANPSSTTTSTSAPGTTTSSTPST